MWSISIFRNGKEWHDLRSKIQKHLMKPRAIQAFLDPMQDVARDLVRKIHKVRDCNKEVPDFLGELYKWSLECTLSKVILWFIFLEISVIKYLT